MTYRTWAKQRQLKVSESFGEGPWETFFKLRTKHNETICEQTNKLVLRLDQLLDQDKLDKSIVEWTPDDLVKLCPFCAKSFNLARRRHHCRPCGAILCNDCSKFLEYRSAIKLIRPSKLYVEPADRIEEKLQQRNFDDMPKIRTCEDCQRLLDKRIQRIEDYYSQPVFYEFYEKLRNSIKEADALISSYNTLKDEQKQTTGELKTKIQEMKQNITTMAAKINKMADRESGKQAYLLRSIKQSIVCWLRESNESKAYRVYGSRSEKSTGWVPEQPACSSDINDDSDPLLVQIKNLEEYIKQAKLADRYEEVSALENSKRDLEIEYLIQRDLKL